MSEILSVPPHRISGQMLAALATGGGGAAAVRQLAAAQYSKHLLLVWAVRDTARRTRHPQASHACRGYDLLAEVQRGAPDAVEAVLRHPSTGAWAARALRSLLGEQEPGGPRPARPGGEPAQLAALAAAAAIRARHPCAIDVPVCRGAVTLPSVGQITLSPGWMAAGRAGGGSAAGDGSAAAGGAVHRGGHPAHRGPPIRPHPRGYPDRHSRMARAAPAPRHGAGDDAPPRAR